MIGVTGIGSLKELQVARPVKGDRNLPVNDLPETGKDALDISEAGKEAAEVARFIRASAGDSEIRQERVDEAKQNLEEGRQRVEEVLNAVAEALLSYV